MPQYTTAPRLATSGAGDTTGSPVSVAQGAALTTTEADRLVELEQTIQARLETYVTVGLALVEIRDSRLYRETHPTFESYLRERWSISRSYAYRLIAAAEVAGDLRMSPAGDTPPERVLRPLARVPVEDRARVWSEAQAAAGDGPVTAAHVEAAIEPQPAKEFHVLLALGEVKDAVWRAIVRWTGHWPETHHGLVPVILSDMACEIERWGAPVGERRLIAPAAPLGDRDKAAESDRLGAVVDDPNSTIEDVSPAHARAEQIAAQAGGYRIDAEAGLGRVLAGMPPWARGVAPEELIALIDERIQEMDALADAAELLARVAEPRLPETQAAEELLGMVRELARAVRGAS